MSIEELKVELDTRLHSELIKEINGLPERISAHIDSAAWDIISTALGVKKDRWESAWEIDRHDKKSAIALALGEHALAQVQQAIPGYIAGLMVQDPRIPPIKSAFQKAYREHLAELTNHKIWEIAQERAKKRFSEIIEQVSGEPVKLEDEDDDAA